MKIVKNKKLTHRSVLLILGVVYFLITILAVISYISSLENISNTPVTISSIISSIWWQLLMVFLFAVSFFLYGKNEKLGILVEIIMGFGMLAYIVVSIATLGANILAIMIELIYPALLVTHGIIAYKSLLEKNN